LHNWIQFLQSVQNYAVWFYEYECKCLHYTVSVVFYFTYHCNNVLNTFGFITLNNRVISERWILEGCGRRH
jgi:hypothetical protein